MKWFMHQYYMGSLPHIHGAFCGQSHTCCMRNGFNVKTAQQLYYKSCSIRFYPIISPIVCVPLKMDQPNIYRGYIICSINTKV